MRHPWRRRLGRIYYRTRRKLLWLRQRDRFAKHQQVEKLPQVWMEHQSKLLRELKDVEMYLQHNKVTNLGLALQPISGLLIRPGETFSFWYRVGNTTARKGYLPGLALHQGKMAVNVGGGLCQMGNLLHWLALHSPLEITERYRHGFDVFPDVQRKVPFGSGATLAYNYIDLQIKNPTGITFQWDLWLSDTHLHGALRAAEAAAVSYEVYEAEHYIHHEPWGGYTRHNLLHRKTVDKATGEVLADEPVVENHAVMMYNPLLPAYEPTSFAD